MVWIYEAGLEPSAPLEDHLYFLVERLRDRYAGLAELAKIANVELWLSTFAGSSGASAIINSQVMSELGELGVDIVFDLHALKS